MIIYYSRTQKTKIAAQALGEVTGLPLYELNAEIADAHGVKFAWKAIRSVMGAKGSPVTNLPGALPEEIWLCAPIWAGEIAGPGKYFLANTDLTQTRVNILLTGMSPSHQNEKAARRLLERTGAQAGTVLMLATPKQLPEPETVREHLRELLNEK